MHDIGKSISLEGRYSISLINFIIHGHVIKVTRVDVDGMEGNFSVDSYLDAAQFNCGSA